MRGRTGRAAFGATAVATLGAITVVAGGGPAGCRTDIAVLFEHRGVQASAATVPAGICFVTITADGARGGASSVSAGTVVHPPDASGPHTAESRPIDDGAAGLSNAYSGAACASAAIM